jgi:phosphate transport system permease protein
MIQRISRRRKNLEKFVFLGFSSSALLNGFVLLIIVYFLLSNGLEAISFEFLTKPPTDSMTKGGIFPCIMGTFLLCVVTIITALPIGIASAIYLNEYAAKGNLVRIIRMGINNLAGVPSIVFGLFGLAFFCIVLKMGVSIIAGGFTLAIMTLPVIIASSEEALKSVPDTYRQASLAMGATKWQTIRKIVVPAAFPGIITGAILGLSRAAGETAPIMYTGAVFFSPMLPTSPFDEVMALPYHIYVLATAGTNIEQTLPLQYGTALVLIALVFGMNLVAIILRSRIRKKMKL